MAVYFVTGKLGSGKTLAAVGKMRDALEKGLPVASNLDLRLNKLIGPQSKNAKVYRLPDKPTVRDMHAIGSGNLTYEEEKNGLIVLDECGTWFNSRDWQDKDRRPLIDWLLHARKLGWDILFIIQDVSMIDKQARKSVGEFVVYCRRLDKLKIPLVDRLYKFVTNKEFPKAKMHMGIVKYGDLPNSLTVDRWYYMARDLYPAYDTKQIFSDDYPHGIYQMLPPYYSHGRYALKHDLRFYMRITKIYLKRFSKVGMLAAGIAGGAVIAAYVQPDPKQAELIASESPQILSGKPATDKEQSEEDEPKTVAETFAGFVVSGVAADNSGKPLFVQIESPNQRYNLQTLRSAGYVVKMVNKCQVLIMNRTRDQSTRLFTSYCPPTDAPDEPPHMGKDERYRWLLTQEKAERDYRQHR